MRKFYDVEHDEIFTEEQLSAFYAKGEGDRELYPTFEIWLREITGQNGTLEEIAPEYEIDNKRKWTATKIAAQTDLNYEEILEVLRKWNVHGNWTKWEINHRPVDIDELAECVEQELGLRR